LSSESNWKKWITLTETGEGGSSYTVTFYNGKVIGEFSKADDGYYWYDGLVIQESHVMRVLADALDELNKPWDDELNAYFNPRGEEPDLNPILYN
jgi:hypothetical protein